MPRKFSEYAISGELQQLTTGTIDTDNLQINLSFTYVPAKDAAVPNDTTFLTDSTGIIYMGPPLNQLTRFLELTSASDVALSSGVETNILTGNATDSFIVATEQGTSSFVCSILKTTSPSRTVTFRFYIASGLVDTQIITHDGTSGTTLLVDITDEVINDISNGALVDVTAESSGSNITIQGTITTTRLYATKSNR